MKTGFGKDSITKFIVRRTDGTSEYGQKHDGCEYFVLDMTHDPYAKAAASAYVEACKADYPLLAADMVRDFKLAPPRAEALAPHPQHGEETPREVNRRERRGVALGALDHLLNVAVKPYVGDRHSEQDLIDSARIVSRCIGDFESEANDGERAAALDAAPSPLAEWTTARALRAARVIAEYALRLGQIIGPIDPLSPNEDPASMRSRLWRVRELAGEMDRFVEYHIDPALAALARSAPAETVEVEKKNEDDDARVDGVPSDRPMGSTASGHEVK